MRPALLLLLALLAIPSSAQTVPASRDGRPLRGNFRGELERPLRYTPENGAFLIVDGRERFNRPLYGGASAFRVDAGDRPEFSLYLPGRGGVLRLAFLPAGQALWLSDAARILTRYRDGAQHYEILDPRLSDAPLRLTAVAARDGEGLILSVHNDSGTQTVELAALYGGITGERGRRDGDIGTEPQAIGEYFRFRPEHAADNSLARTAAGFAVRAPKGYVHVLLPAGATTAFADADREADLPALLASTTTTAAPARPLGVARFSVPPRGVVHLALQNIPLDKSGQEVLETYRLVAAERSPRLPDAAALVRWTPDELPGRFARELATQRALAQRVVAETPDPFIDAAVPALNVAADAVWDDRQQAWLHGGVAWRVRLLGWRVGYAGDALGWPERTRAHFDGYAAQQNTSPVPATLPAAEEDARLARNETALHSNGDLTKSHYDMNLLGVDTILRHLRWTGDLAYARQIWPVLERSLAWERRLFRREFGPQRLPLYEGYACIWASDDLTYSGGGATHASALNLFHLREVARLARLLGHDAAPYEQEAALLARGLEQQLWLPERGWFAESRDLLGRQNLHPSAAAWTVYHALDSGAAPSPRHAWQLARYVENELPQFPLSGPGVPTGAATIATTNWMPYTWSLNNVVFAETTHTALALWQSGHAEAALRYFRGAVLDSMYLGQCPGNVGMATWFDVNRRESQRDFGDGVGAFSRALVEGLFGVQPDLLAGEIVLRPGWPAAWPHAALRHPNFDLRFERLGDRERYTFTPRFARPVQLRLDVRAARDELAAVLINGQPAPHRVLTEAVGAPRIEVLAPTADQFSIELQWRGRAPVVPPAESTIATGAPVTLDAGADIAALDDPQHTLAAARIAGPQISATVTGWPGHRTVFARVTQGALTWWQPLALHVREAAPAAPQVFTTDWRKPISASAALTPIDLAPLFNDRVADIFRHDYLSPRSPFVSLALPRQGFGSWTKPAATFTVDDSGLRAAARAHGDRLLLPNGVPLATPGASEARNVAFVSQWDNFPRELTIPLAGRASRVYLLMAGTTWANQSRLDNGELVVTYRDGSTTRLALANPTTWWPLDQDYFIDDYAFARPGALPLRVNLATGEIRVLEPETFRGRGGPIKGGAATVLDLTLDPSKELQSLTVRALANDVILGLLSATLQRD